MNLKHCLIRPWTGAAADLPVYRLVETGMDYDGQPAKYRFDTYGGVPCNYNDWKWFIVGIGGASGWTDKNEVLERAIWHTNKVGLVSLVDVNLVELCVEYGAEVTSTRYIDPEKQRAYDDLVSRSVSSAISNEHRQR